MAKSRLKKAFPVSLTVLLLFSLSASTSNAFPTRAEEYHVRCSNCHGIKSISAVLSGPEKVRIGQAFTVSAYLDGQAEKLIVEKVFRSAGKSASLAALDKEIRSAGYDSVYDYLLSRNPQAQANGKNDMMSGALLVVPKGFEGLLSLAKGPSRERAFSFRLEAPKEPGTYVLFLEAVEGKPNNSHGGTGSASFTIEVEK